MVEPARAKETEGCVGRERILRHAEALFAEQGYNAVSIRDIAQATGLSHGAIYHHFASKEDLFGQLIEDSVRCLVEALRQAAGPPESGTTRERVHRLCQTFVELGVKRREMFMHIQRDLSHVDYERVQRVMRCVREDLVGEFDSVLRDGIVRGEVRELDTHTAAVALMGMLNTTFHPATTGPASPDERLDFVIDLFFDGVGA